MATATMTRPSLSASRPQPPVPRRRRLLRLLVLITVLAVLGTGGWLLGFSSVFATQQVTVSDVRVLTKSVVRSTAAVPLDLPLARQDLAAVADRVAGLAPVESVSVQRRWPHTVAITVTERTPAISVRHAGQLVLVDRHGVAYDTVAKSPSGVMESTVDPANGPLLVEVAEVAASLPGSLHARADSISATSAAVITLKLDDGVSVVWGSRADSELKGRIVLALLQQKGTLRQIDVSSPHNPAVR